MTPKQLVISPDLSLPINAITNKMAHMGSSGSGKTYGLGKVAEEMYQIGGQIIILDPVGVHWGLRLAADGKSPGLPIPVFGGLHGDVPLDPYSGALVANLIFDRGISAVLDLSQMESDADMTRFVTDFGRQFFKRQKASPRAVHIFLDECHEIVPQNPVAGEQMKLHIWQKIQKLGRNFGIGLSLASQRPQEVNKKVLNLTQCMFAYQMTGPQERKVMVDWMESQELDEDIAKILPFLEIGEPRVYSPRWLKINKTIKIGLKITFDSSATPEFGVKTVEPKLLSPVDLDEIRTAMSEVIAEAEKSDPSKLQKQLDNLKKENARLVAKLDKIDTAPKAEAKPKVEIKYVDRPIFDADLIKRIEELQNGARVLAKDFLAGASSLEIAARAKDEQPYVISGSLYQRVDTPQPGRVEISSEIANPIPQPATPGDKVITEAHRKILIALAQNCVGLTKGVNRKRLALLTGYAPTGGGYGGPLKDLKGWGFIVTDGSGEYNILRAGRDAIGNSWEPLPKGKALGEYWLNHLDAPEAKILKTLMRHHPNPIGRDKVASESGYTNANGGGFNKPFKKVRGLGLIEGKKLFRVNGELMGEGETENE